MVDTKDSKSFVSDGVRVQVSSPVGGLPILGSPFFLTTVTAQELMMRIICANLWLPAYGWLLFGEIGPGRRWCGQF